MKKKIYLLILLLAISTVSISIYYIRDTLKTIIDEKAKEIYQTRKKEYEVILKNKKNFLNSFAKFLSTSQPVIDAYLENNRSKIINFVMPLYKSLYPNLIEEIHFFKCPAISFVNFANLKNYNFDVSKTRADILWVSTSFSPSTHFYICKFYPGLRATYPIIYKDKLLGSVSFGINIKIFKKLFEELNAKSVSIYIKDNSLKKLLLPHKYESFAKLPFVNEYRVIGKPFNVSLNEGYEVKDHFVYTKIKIIDFFKKPIGYIIIEDDAFKAISIIKQHARNKVIIELLSYLFIFAITIFLFKWIFDKLNEMNSILKYIKSYQFDKIPNKVKPKDELDEFKNNLIDVANDIKTYINILTQKVEKYATKIYKDGLTEAFNRNFLEDKANEIFLKSKLSNTYIGVIMLDIDNFKQINDTYGHDIGDLVLINLAKTINNTIRKNDILIRYGGEEFLIILQDSNIDNIYKIAEKIRKNIESITINIGDKHIKFTISLGVSKVQENDETLNDAIKRADINLYKAKKAGKNRVEV